MSTAADYPLAVPPPNQRCLCGHDRNLHHRDRLCTATASCPCDSFALDDGTLGPSALDGPRWDSDLYSGKYGTNRRWEKP